MSAGIYNWIRNLNRLRRKHKAWLGAWTRNEIRRRRHAPRPHCVGVLGIMKNEQHSIDEWVSHYRSIGVERIFLIDNGSTDGTLDKARRWVAEGVVELVEYPQQHRQQQHYWAAFQHFAIARHCDWLMIADLDEFWFCKNGEPMPDYLKRHPGVDVILANWSMFGSNGYQSQPESMRRAFTKRDPVLDKHTKFILRTHLPFKVNQIRVHDVPHASPFRTLQDNQHLQLNHYATQSRDFWFKVKMRRGDVYYAAPDLAELAQRFEIYDAKATEVDTVLHDIVTAAARGQGGTGEGRGEIRVVAGLRA